MGIRGLRSWIQWAAKDTIQDPVWESFRGKTIGVDILGLLYFAKSHKQCPFHYIGKLVASIKRCDIRIVPIFDGKPPLEKVETIKQRSQIRDESVKKRTILEHDLESIPLTDMQRSTVELEIRKLEKKESFITSEEREIAKQLFYACGVLPLNATGEADNVLAYFAKRGLFDAIISNDFDILARGVEILLVPEFYALPGDRSGWAQYNLTNILQSVGFQYEQFLEMCVLMGSDYTSGTHYLPYKMAFWSIKYGGSFEKALEKLKVKDMSMFQNAREILRGEKETNETLMGEKQWEKWANTTPQTEPEKLHEYRKLWFHELSECEFDSLLQ